MTKKLATEILLAKGFRETFQPLMYLKEFDKYVIMTDLKRNSIEIYKFIFAGEKRLSLTRHKTYEDLIRMTIYECNKLKKLNYETKD